MEVEQALLSLLTEERRPLADLSQALGVSLPEAALAVGRLREEGFPVIGAEEVALERGAPAPQIFLPLIRSRLGRPYRYLGTVKTTQDELRAWEAPTGAMVVAERQTLGRGRLGRPWESPGGGLYFSCLVPLSELLPLRAGLALVEAAGVGSLKWPNDLLAPDGRKLAGILIESEPWARRAYLGVGVNTNRAPIPEAASLSEFRFVHRAQFLADFLCLLEGWLSQRPGQVLQAWRARNVTLGHEVRVCLGQGKVVEGEALDISPKGGLLVRTTQGVCEVTAGDVGLRA